jgi:hypothetical protein
MLSAAAPRRAGANGYRERPARLMLASTGVTLAIAPPFMVAGFGWAAIPLMSVMPLGVLLVVLSAFYLRINGEVRCGVFSVPIGPTVERSLESKALASPDGETQAEGSAISNPESSSGSAT